MLDTVSQQFMVGIGGWEIIKHHDTWIDTQEINMGGSSKARHHLTLVDARGVAKICLDGKRYLVIFRQAFSNPNSDETMLRENQIECFGVKLYSRPMVFGGKNWLVPDTRWGIPLNWLYPGTYPLDTLISTS